MSGQASACLDLERVRWEGGRWRFAKVGGQVDSYPLVLNASSILGRPRMAE